MSPMIEKVPSRAREGIVVLPHRQGVVYKIWCKLALILAFSISRTQGHPQLL